MNIDGAGLSFKPAIGTASKAAEGVSHGNNSHGNNTLKKDEFIRGEIRPIPGEWGKRPPICVMPKPRPPICFPPRPWIGRPGGNATPGNPGKPTEPGKPWNPGRPPVCVDPKPFPLPHPFPKPMPLPKVDPDDLRKHFDFKDVRPTNG